MDHCTFDMLIRDEVSSHNSKRLIQYHMAAYANMDYAGWTAAATQKLDLDASKVPNLHPSSAPPSRGRATFR